MSSFDTQEEKIPIAVERYHKERDGYSKYSMAGWPITNEPYNVIRIRRGG